MFQLVLAENDTTYLEFYRQYFASGLPNKEKDNDVVCVCVVGVI